ncbi:hypothetical protein Hamer_G021443 [Homarus americanus]|uniref:Uncharacterized protein n=1 Tax=Homarus americanus TaxID=6706 RepID=A0A8J5JFQ1_HOMAM|nr:hypothetical protein Hamer_G021443 [Homarus americanus]
MKEQDVTQDLYPVNNGSYRVLWSSAVSDIQLSDTSLYGRLLFVTVSSSHNTGATHVTTAANLRMVLTAGNYSLNTQHSTFYIGVEYTKIYNLNTRNFVKETLLSVSVESVSSSSSRVVSIRQDKGVLGPHPTSVLLLMINTILL